MFSRSFSWLAHRCHVMFCHLVAAKGKWLAKLFCSLLFFVVYYSKLVTEFSGNRRDYFCDCQDPQVKPSVKENNYHVCVRCCAVDKWQTPNSGGKDIFRKGVSEV